MKDDFNQLLEEEYQVVVKDVEQWEKEDEKSRTFNFMGQQFVEEKQDLEPDDRFAKISLTMAILTTFLWAIFYLG